MFGDRHLTHLEEITRAVCADFECEPVEFNGEGEHLHLLLNFPPKVALSKLVNSLKGVSSRRTRQEFPDLVRTTTGANRLCSASYGAGSVCGAPLTALRQYIEQQNPAGQHTLGPNRPSRAGLHPTLKGGPPVRI